MKIGMHDDRNLEFPGVMAAFSKERGLAALMLAGLAFFARPLWFGESFFYRDLYLYFLPIKKILAEVLGSGELPLWNTYLHGGQPLLAEISSSTLYPSNVLYLLLPVTQALSLDIVLHVLASSAALYVLARRLGISQPASAIGGLVYGYCGFTLSQANLYFRLLATPYLPLLLICWDGLLLAEPGQRRRWYLGLVGLGALQVFAGSGEMLILTWSTLLLWGLTRPARECSRGRMVVSWGVAGLIAAALSAPQLLPLVEMVGQSQRGDGLAPETTLHWSVHPRRLPELVLPGFMGRTDTQGEGDYWGTEIVDTGFPFMLSLYASALVIALALLAGLRRGDGFLPRRLRYGLLALWLLSVLLALGRWLPLSEWLLQFPGMHLFRYPVKFMNLGILPMALLAAEGVGVLRNLGREPGIRGRRAAVISSAIAGIMLVGWLLLALSPDFSNRLQRLCFDDHGPVSAQGLQDAWRHMTLVWLAATLVYVLGRSRPRLATSWMLVAIVAIDLMTAGRRVNPTAPITFLAKEPPAAALVREQLQDGRFYREPLTTEPAVRAPGTSSIWLTLWNQEVLRFYLAAGYGIPIIFHDDYNGLASKRVMQQKWTIEALPWERRLPLLSAAAVRVLVSADEISLPGVERVGSVASSAQPFHIYRLNTSAKRAELITAYQSFASAEDAMAAMLVPGFDPRQHAVVEGDVPAADPTCRGRGRVETLVRRPHHHRISVVSDCPRLLVLSEVWYPGWQAKVDGERTPILRANVAFSAIWLPAGEHDIEWRYVPKSLYLGFGISLVSLIGLVLSGEIYRRRRKLGSDRAS